MKGYKHLQSPDEETLTVFLEDGGPPIAINDDHPNFMQVLDLVSGENPDDTQIRELSDLSVAVSNQVTYLSERVSVANGTVFFDGDEIDNSIAHQIVRLLEDDALDKDTENNWVALVKFLENLAANPSQHSRTQLYDWLAARDFTITGDGYLIGYKGVRETDDGLESVHTGTATVDGERITGHIPQPAGGTIEMPRSEVREDPSVSCHVGLHVGTYNYAKQYGSVLLKVRVNPRDVVSVPDGEAEKFRCCRYTVLETHGEEEQESAPVVYDQASETATVF